MSLWHPARIITKHTQLLEKEVAGVIDHADSSITRAKIVSQKLGDLNDELPVFSTNFRMINPPGGVSYVWGGFDCVDNTNTTPTTVGNAKLPALPNPLDLGTLMVRSNFSHYTTGAATSYVEVYEWIVGTGWVLKHSHSTTTSFAWVASTATWTPTLDTEQNAYSYIIKTYTSSGAVAARLGAGQVTLYRALPTACYVVT